MAVKPAKATTPPDLVAQSAAPLITEINLEEAIADQLLDSIDWAKVRSALLKKAPAKLFAWLVSGNDTPVNISAYPELAALPSADGEEKAA
jgi:hypothetical protein